MNGSKLSQGQIIAAAGGALLIISLFLHWAGGVSAWNGFSVVHILMLLVGIAAIAWAVLPSTGAAVTLPPTAPLILTALGLAVFGFAAGWEFEVSGGVGVWIAILGAVGVAYGAYLGGQGAAARPRTAAAAAPMAPPPGPPAV